MENKFAMVSMTSILNSKSLLYFQFPDDDMATPIKKCLNHPDFFFFFNFWRVHCHGTNKIHI